MISGAEELGKQSSATQIEIVYFLFCTLSLLIHLLIKCWITQTVLLTKLNM